MADFAPTRRHPRVSLRVPVEVSTIDPERDPRTGRPYFRECEELCGNLSSGGMFIHTADPPGAGRRLLVRIHAPGAPGPIEAVAHVAWRQPRTGPGAHEPGVGVEFVGTSPRTRAAIARILGATEATVEAAGDR